MTFTRGRVVVVLAAVAAMAMLIPVAASGAGGQLEATLKGKSEVPGPGDPNGKGEALVQIKKKKRKVTFDVEFARIEPATAIHIHRGKKGVEGPIKVPLFEGDPQRSPIAGTVRGVKKRLLGKIKRNPGRFYVNVHNEDFPGGAIRGQLKNL